MRVALYTRVSTKDKEKGEDGQSKPRQTTANQVDQLRESPYRKIGPLCRSTRTTNPGAEPIALSSKPS